MRRSCLAVFVAACALGLGVELVTAQGREPNGLPDISGKYDGNMKIKFRHMETDGENGKKKEPFTRVLFQKGSAVDGKLISANRRTRTNSSCPAKSGSVRSSWRRSRPSARSPGSAGPAAPATTSN